MDWMQQIDAYCERTDFSFWSEPVNALTNLLYLAGALGMGWRVRHDRLPLAMLLAVLLGAIAVGSFLFHTVATAWAAAADTTPIGLFILVYLFAVNRDMLSLPLWGAAFGTLAFVPYAWVMVPLLDRLPFLGISNFYWTVPLLLVVMAPLVARRNPATARGLLMGAGLLCVSISVRSVDETLCDAFPIGTHFRVALPERDHAALDDRGLSAACDCDTGCAIAPVTAQAAAAGRLRREYFFKRRSRGRRSFPASSLSKILRRALAGRGPPVQGARRAARTLAPPLALA